MPERGTPSPWLTAHRDQLPEAGHALDVACGRGRHAIWLAEQGFSVHAVDRDGEAIAALADEARRRGLPIDARVGDLEQSDGSVGTWALAAATYDVVVVFCYLHRPFVPQLVASIVPGGTLVYETFTTAQAARGKPTNPAFLLRPGELRELVRPLEILSEREGEFEGKMLASVVARRARRGGP